MRALQRGGRPVILAGWRRHFPNSESAIAETFRSLVPGGRFAFTDWTPPASNPFMRLIPGAVQAHGTLDLNPPPGPLLFRFGDRIECERAPAIAGLEPVSVTEVPTIWPFATAEAVVPEVIASAARLGPILAAQTVEQGARLEDAIVAGAGAYGSDRGISIPTSVLLSLGRRP